MKDNSLSQTFSLSHVCPLSLPPSLSLSYKYSLSLSFKYSFSLMYLHMHVLSLSPSLFHSNNHSFGLKYVPLSLSLSPSYICPLSLPLSDTSTISFTHSFSLSFIHMSSLSPSIIQMPSFSLSFVLSIIHSFMYFLSLSLPLSPSIIQMPFFSPSLIQVLSHSYIRSLYHPYISPLCQSHLGSFSPTQFQFIKITK